MIGRGDWGGCEGVAFAGRGETGEERTMPGREGHVPLLQKEKVELSLEGRFCYVIITCCRAH